MNTLTPNVIVAADGGGSGCRAAAGTVEQGILGQASAGPGNVHNDFETAVSNLTAAIGQALDHAGLGNTPLDQVTAHLGVAGAHSQVEEQALSNALPYGRVTVSGDRATSVRGALGTADGFVVALGTGTIVARQQDLQMTTVGGWGFNLSDQASGAWLGRRLLEEIILAEDGLREHSDLSRTVSAANGGLMGLVQFSSAATPSQFAKFARELITAASAGDPLGQALMAEGAVYLEIALTKLGFQSGDILALAGGVGPHYAPYLPAALCGNIQPPKGAALEGAFAMAAMAAQAP
ncbi:BadF/BadG/BcrA/BcrD ATPase family protein [Sulfitobacter geojensis]|uniref:BadF/BadG/BcrA/BcrD ATPase family protein n=1 Tax=Sulfitobacter geojensis TaxID=1342299 RepID=UPI0004694549|nr:BadF/BadG/BcrA/BcrD ATPase family protein [Sulfitobacter geojensis]KHA51447.1 ATPase, BadF/BadG/BcrA/BcrD type [Sulfitobacter geojensis]NYI28869.1 glucosamine kinase [Sulfitobacter geojensis]